MNIKSHPGPQKKRYAINGLTILLYFFTLLFLCLTCYAVIQKNKEFLGCQDIALFKIKILDPGAAFTIFATFIGIIIARNNISHGLKPYIVYECKRGNESLSGLPGYSKYLTVQIKNVGMGVALIESVRYKITFKDSTANNHPYESYENVIDKLKAKGFSKQKDFYLLEISKGFALSAKDEKIIFEIPIIKADSISSLDIKIIFKGFLNDSYQKEVYCIPRKGI